MRTYRARYSAHIHILCQIVMNFDRKGWKEGSSMREFYLFHLSTAPPFHVSADDCDSPPLPPPLLTPFHQRSPHWLSPPGHDWRAVFDYYLNLSELSYVWNLIVAYTWDVSVCILKSGCDNCGCWLTGFRRFCGIREHATGLSRPSPQRRDFAGRDRGLAAPWAGPESQMTLSEMAGGQIDGPRTRLHISAAPPSLRLTGTSGWNHVDASHTSY